MKRRLRDESGMTVIELVLASTLSVLLLGATLTTWERFNSNDDRARRLDEVVELARNAEDHAARQLRNLGKQPGAVAASANLLVAKADDIVFQTSDPQRTWVRYCLDTTSAGASADHGRLWMLERMGTTAPSGGLLGPCPGTGWTAREQKVVAEDVVNAAPSLGAPAPIFRYECASAVVAPPAGCPRAVDAVPADGIPDDYERIKAVSIDLRIDQDLTRAPAPRVVDTAVFLRNQNEKPIARFRSSRTASKTVLLNAAESVDPEGRSLRYYWWRAASAPAGFTCASASVPTTTAVGTAPLAQYQGVTLTQRFGAGDAVGAQIDYTLVVCDAGDLDGRFTAKVTVPS